MHLCRIYAVVASLSLLALWGCARPTGAADGSAAAAAPPGVWWSPALGLESLRDIDRRLAQPFPDSIELAQGREIVEAASCRALLDLRARGYEPAGGSSGYARERAAGAVCAALAALKTASAPRTSHLAGFELNAGAPDLLPPSLAASFLHTADAATKAERAGLSWRAYEPNLSFRVEGDELVARGSTSEVRASIYARGDFDHDGIDDLLVRTGESATGGSFGSTRLLLLTRRQAGSTLSTIRRLQ